MTFEEAFHSGCRFRLPYESNGNCSWPEGFYWTKVSETTVSWGGDALNKYYSQSKPELIFKILKEDPFYSETAAWYLHPEDEQRLKFNKKMNEVINE